MKKTGDKMQILSWETRPALEREHGQVVLQTWKQALAPLKCSLMFTVIKAPEARLKIPKIIFFASKITNFNLGS